VSGLAGLPVLVTGGTGFVGARVVRRLCAAGARVSLLVRETSSPARLGELWTRVERRLGSIEDPDSLARCVRESKPKAVFHLAKERESPSFEREARATLLLASALKAQGAKPARWVRTALAVRERFGRGADDELAAAAARLSGVPVATLELFQVYGPGQPDTDFPLTAAAAALAGRPYEADGGALKDFVFVDDAAGAYERAALADGAAGRRFEIGSGVLTSEAEAAAVLARVLGGPAPSVRPGAGGGGHAADLKPAAAGLGWAPSTALEDGLRSLADWWRSSR
jgi:nucleoside-diphosphate-sugar epimerase